MAICMFFMPESPVYLLSKDKEDEARMSLQWFRGSNHDVTSELKQMKANVEHQASLGSVTVMELITKPVYRKPTLIMLALMIFRQTTGINAVLFYLTDIFIRADTGFSSELQALIVSIVQVVGMIVAVLLVDRFGRRPLLIASALTASVSLFILGTYFYLEENACPESIPNCDDGTDRDLLKKFV